MNASEPYDRFVQYLNESSQILNMCLVSVSSADERVRAEEAFMNLHDGDLPDLIWTDDLRKAHAARIGRLREQAIFANREAERGFPILHGQAMVGLWGALEALVEDLAIAMLEEWPDLLEKQRLTRVKVPLSRFISMDGPDRSRYLIREVTRSTGDEAVGGVAKLDAILSIIGLVSFNDRLGRRDLMEMNAMRNLIVHRSSVVDDKFSSSCPWLSLKPGDEAKVDHDTFQRYSNSVIAYVAQLREQIKDGRVERACNSSTKVIQS